MHSTYLLLAGGLAWAAYPTSVSMTVDWLRKMLKVSDLDDELVEACQAGFKQIEDALKRRNKAVHSWWYHEPDDPQEVFTVSPRTSGQIPETTTWDLGEFKQIEHALRRAGLVASGILSTVSGLTEPEYREPYFRILLTEQMHGRFEFIDDTQFRMTDPEAVLRVRHALDDAKATETSSAAFDGEG